MSGWNAVVHTDDGDVTLQVEAEDIFEAEEKALEESGADSVRGVDLTAEDEQ